MPFGIMEEAVGKLWLDAETSTINANAVGTSTTAGGMAASINGTESVTGIAIATSSMF
ncbi:MAG: hypothetical protein M3O09_11575 [Acidobacteriota bacterium]|nr:hypothetical protein [Acidobacteriota bacterium]